MGRGVWKPQSKVLPPWASREGDISKGLWSEDGLNPGRTGSILWVSQLEVQNGQLKGVQSRVSKAYVVRRGATRLKGRFGRQTCLYNGHVYSGDF